MIEQIELSNTVHLEIQLLSVSSKELIKMLTVRPFNSYRERTDFSRDFLTSSEMTVAVLSFIK